MPGRMATETASFRRTGALPLRPSCKSEYAGSNRGQLFIVHPVRDHGLDQVVVDHLVYGSG